MTMTAAMRVSAETAVMNHRAFVIAVSPEVASATIPARGSPMVCPIETPRVRWPNFDVIWAAGKLCGMSAWEATVVSSCPTPRLIVATSSTPRLGAMAASATGRTDSTVPVHSTAVA